METWRLAIRLFQSQIIPALLFNSESWIDLSQAHLSDLQNFQDKFLRKLMRMPPITTKALLHWDRGMEMMKWRIAKKKIVFIRNISMRNNDSICKQTIMNEFFSIFKV